MKRIIAIVAAFSIVVSSCFAIDLSNEIDVSIDSKRTLYESIVDSINDVQDQLDNFDLSDIENAISDIEDQIAGIDIDAVQDALDKAEEAIDIANGFATDINDAKDKADSAIETANTAQTIAAGANATGGLAYSNSITNASNISALDGRVTAIESNGGNGGGVTIDQVARDAAEDAQTTANTATVLAGLAQGTATANSNRIDDVEDRIDAIEQAGDIGIDHEARDAIASLADDVSDIEGRVYALESVDATFPDYSIGATRTGRKWVDGDDIYEKVVLINGLPSSRGSSSFPHGEDVKTLVRFEGIASQSGGVNRILIPHAGAYVDGAFNVGVEIDSANIIVTASNDLSTYTENHVIMYFTKN